MSEVQDAVAAWRYGKHSVYNRERLGTGTYLVDFSRASITGRGRGAHRSKLDQYGFGPSFEGQVVWSWNRGCFVKRSKDHWWQRVC